MTCVIINDASCLIDLRKGQLLHVLGGMPYRFVIPLPIRHSELLDFTDQEWRVLDDSGVETFDLPAERVAEAMAVRRSYPRLSSNDCFCLISARHFEGSILLTGDRLLRRVADETGARVHGVLWIIDELRRIEACGTDLMVTALETWRDDPSVFLPESEIAKRLRIFQ